MSGPTITRNGYVNDDQDLFFDLVQQIPAWQAKAACIGCGPDPWFHFDTRGVKRQDLIRTAQSICTGCPVRVECLEYANANRIEFGIWGGLLPDERKKSGRVPPSKRGRFLAEVERLGGWATVAELAEATGRDPATIRMHVAAAHRDGTLERKREQAPGSASWCWSYRRAAQ